MDLTVVLIIKPSDRFNHMSLINRKFMLLRWRSIYEQPAVYPVKTKPIPWAELYIIWQSHLNSAGTKPNQHSSGSLCVTLEPDLNSFDSFSGNIQVKDFSPPPFQNRLKYYAIYSNRCCTHCIPVMTTRSVIQTF